MSKRLQGEEMRRAVSISLIYAIASFIVLQPIPLNAVEKEVNVPDRLQEEVITDRQSVVLGRGRVID